MVLFRVMCVLEKRFILFPELYSHGFSRPEKIHEITLWKMVWVSPKFGHAHIAFQSRIEIFMMNVFLKITQ